MARLTIRVDAETLFKARTRAAERGESVNQYLAQKLAEYAEAGRKERSARRLGELADKLARVSTTDAPYTREELWERV